MYIGIGVVILVVIFVMHYLQYTITYMGTYKESERRRITLAEKLRTLPLRFFQEHDLSDLTSTIMGDCSGFEHAFSHTVPQFWGSIISTAIVCIALLIYDWRMGLATVIVVGNALMINNQTTLFSYILFLIAASRLYDPLSGAMSNMAELFSVDLQVNRLKAIQNYQEENKKKEHMMN